MNFDAEVELDSAIFRKGKRVQDCMSLKIQCECILLNGYCRNALADVKVLEQLWDHLPSLILSTVGRLEKRWFQIFKIRIVNWIPEAALSST